MRFEKFCESVSKTTITSQPLSLCYSYSWAGTATTDSYFKVEGGPPSLRASITFKKEALNLIKWATGSQGEKNIQDKIVVSHT